MVVISHAVSDGRAPGLSLRDGGRNVPISGVPGQGVGGGPPELFPQPYLFIQGFAPTADTAHADPRSLSAFGLIQDDWKVGSRTTLNLGVRYDIERVSNVRNFAAPVDKNNLQPRVGIAWEPFAGQRMRSYRLPGSSASWLPGAR